MRLRVAFLLQSRWFWLLSAAGGILCLLDGPTHDWARLVGGAAIALGIAAQVVLLGLAWRAGGQRTFRVRSATAAALGLGVASWWWVGDERRAGPGSSFDGSALHVALAVTGMLVVVGLDRRSARYAPGLRARQLAGASEVSPPLPRFGYGWSAGLFCLVLVVGFVLGAFAPSPYALLAMALPAAVLIALIHHSHRPQRRYERGIVEALAALGPVFVLPYNGAAAFHVGMWAPFLQRAGHPVIVVTTRQVAFERVPAVCPLPILYAPGHSRADVAAMFPATLRAAFYVYNGGNEVFLRQRRLRHVFLQHGDSDKDTSISRVAGLYDTVVVAGQAGIDRFREHGVEIPAERFVILGRPQAAQISTAARPITDVAHPVVLYAPTWKGKSEEVNYSSLLVGRKIVAALLTHGATVIFRPHPAGRSHRPHVRAIAKIKSLLAADAEKTGRPHRWGVDAEALSVADVANLSDAMVADVSGIVTDYMQSLKPFAMVATRTGTDAFRERFPTSEAAYVISGDLSNLDAELQKLLGSDPLAQRRRERRAYYLGGFDHDESPRAFAAFLEGLASSTRPPTRR